MLMTEIRKEKVNDVIHADASLAVLAESARSILGYDLLAKTVEKKAAATEDETTLLRQVLASLDLEVLNAFDVAKYQKERMIERTAELAKEWMEELAKRSFEQIRSYAFDAFHGPNWRLSKIEEYKQPIPEFVLAKAVQIKEKMPEVTILIESLEDHPDPFLIVAFPAPAYSWEKPKEHYYIEVWAEPKFEGMLSSGATATSAIDDIPF